MRRWIWSAITAVVASLTAVTINLATDLMDNVWVWIAVGVLTVISISVVFYTQSGPAQPEQTINNTVSGVVNGTVLQAHTVGSINLGGPPEPSFGTEQDIRQKLNKP